MFYRGYLESFTTGLKSPRTSLKNVALITEKTNENNLIKCSNTNDIDKKHDPIKELPEEIINKVLY